MRYSTPELVIVGTAAGLVQGSPGGALDNEVSVKSQPAEGLALGLDD